MPLSLHLRQVRPCLVVDFVLNNSVKCGKGAGTARKLGEEILTFRVKALGSSQGHSHETSTSPHSRPVFWLFIFPLSVFM